MAKFLKLGKYPSLPNSKEDCELKGRDFDYERRFPLFEFLRVGLGPPVYDFEVVNDCLLARR
jgi:hypothetical protein